MIHYIQQMTYTRGLKSKKWKQIVDEIIMPKMAGEGNEPIKDDLLNLLTFHSIAVLTESYQLHQTMMKIALQRISRGAVDHESIVFPALEDKYSEYASTKRKTARMSVGCYNFIMGQAMDYCLNNKVLKHHAIAILFGIVEHISPYGYARVSPYGYARGGSYIPVIFNQIQAISLRNRALRLLNKHASFNELYEHFARPEVWKEHKAFFAQNRSKIVWEHFFIKTNSLSGSALKQWWQKRMIINDLKKYV